MSSRKLLFVFCVLISWSCAGYGQDVDDFLRCAEFTDRVERVFCLENALDEATAVEAAETEEVAVAEESEPEPVIVNTQESTQTTVTATEEPEAARESRFRLPVIGNIFRRNREGSDTEEEIVTEPEEVTSEPAEETGTDRVASFGRADRQARVVTGDDGNDVLVDVVSELDMTKPNLWQVTLASGQVWQQTHVKRFNLREGDPVRIYPSGWGKNYRLETERLNGFIQVERVK